MCKVLWGFIIVSIIEVVAYHDNSNAVLLHVTISSTPREDFSLIENLDILKNELVDKVTNACLSVCVLFDSLVLIQSAAHST